MSKIVRVENGVVDTAGLTGYQVEQLYNCLDSAVTAQLLPVMKKQANDNQLLTYARERRFQSLCMEMEQNGVPIDPEELLQLLYELEGSASKALSILHEFCDAVGYHHFNPGSSQQMIHFFYTYLALPTVYKFNHETKERNPTTDRDALEKMLMYPIAAPFVKAIIAYREAKKLASTFKRGVDPDGRLRATFTVSTTTGRMASHKNGKGRGTNLQNWNERIRRVVRAKPGFILASPDLKTAESIAVGYISGDRAYIDACESGDLHTTVARMVWDDLPWTGDLKTDKEMADSLLFYRFFSYRYTCKRIGHGSNYYGTPRTISKETTVPIPLVERFQYRYFGAFPGIRDWQSRVIERVQRDRVLVNRLGRERRFWGHPNDSATHRAAIAHDPQGLVADVMNEGICQAMEWVQQENLPIKVCAQVHDNAIFEMPLDRELIEVYLPQLNERLHYPVDFGELGTMRIPVEMSLGRRWAKRKEKWEDGKMIKLEIPDGQVDWSPAKTDRILDWARAA